jgi:hypothetical protein
MFRIVCDPSSGSIELCLTEIIRGGSQMFVVCLVGVWQRNLNSCVYGTTGPSPSYRTHTHHFGFFGIQKLLMRNIILTDIFSNFQALKFSSCAPTSRQLQKSFHFEVINFKILRILYYGLHIGLTWRTVCTHIIILFVHFFIASEYNKTIKLCVP